MDFDVGGVGASCESMPQEVATEPCESRVDTWPRRAHAERMLLLFIAALIILDVAALAWGYDSRTPAALEDPYRPDLW